MSLLGNRKTLVVYGYGIEILLSGLVYLLLWIQGWFVSASQFLEQSAGYFLTFFGILLAGAMAARLVFFTLNSGDFSSWLEWKKVGGIISGAFLFNVLLFTAATISSLILVSCKGTWFTSVTLFVAILGIVNSLTFPLFVYSINRLQAKFNFEFKKATEAEKKTSK